MQLTVSPERPAAKVRNPWLVVVPLAVASATAALQQSAMVPLLPTLPEALGTSVGAATWAFTASLLVGAVATPLLSRFGDMYGRRRVVLIALGLLVIGSVIGGVSTTLPGLLTARVLQGFSAALIPLSIGLAREALPRHQLATGIGVLSATLGFGSGGGMILAGVAGGYRAVFWVTGAVALVITVVVALLVREPAPAPGGRPDLPGTILLTLALTALLLAISQGGSWGWTSPAVLGLFALSAVIAVIWVAVERRVAEPLIEIPMLTHRGTLGATGSGLILGFTLFLSMTTMSGFAQSQGSTTLQVGVYLLPTTMLMLVISLFAGRMMRRLSAPTLVATGSLVVGAADLWLLAFHRGEFDMYAATTLLGIGIGAAYAALGTMAVQHVEPAKTAVASGVNSLMRVVGGSMCGAVLAAILAAHTPAGSAVPSVTGYEVSLAVAAAGALVAALFAAGFARYARAAAPEPALADA